MRAKKKDKQSTNQTKQSGFKYIVHVAAKKKLGMQCILSGGNGQCIQGWGMGWDGIYCGYGVATDIKKVRRSIPLL